MITEDISLPNALNVSSNAFSSLKGRKVTLSVWLTAAIIFGLSVAATASEVRP